MPFPARDPNKPRPVWGKTKSRKYVIWYCSRKKDSADEGNWLVGEFRGVSVAGAHNAVVRSLREKLPDIRKSDVLILEAHVLPPRVSMDKYLADLYGGGDEE